jgi:hypothetical protein
MKELKLRKRGYRGLAAFGSGGAAVAVTMLMLLAPLSAATTVVIPIKKFGSSVGYSVNTGACAKAKQMVAPKWSPATGMFKSAGSATAPKCAPSTSTNFGSWNSQVDLTTYIHFKANGSYTLTASWKIIEAVSWNQTPFKGCALNYKASFSSCATSASAEIFGFAYLYDTSNSSWGNYGTLFGTYVNVYNSSYAQNYSSNYCYSGTCTHYGGNFSSPGPTAGSFSGTVYQNSTISAGATSTSVINHLDTYELIIVLLTFVDAQASVQNAKAVGVGTATAAINIGTLGFGAQLLSVSYV